jgi:hypothetical protein
MVTKGRRVDTTSGQNERFREEKYSCLFRPYANMPCRVYVSMHPQRHADALSFHPKLP